MSDKTIIIGVYKGRAWVRGQPPEGITVQVRDYDLPTMPPHKYRIQGDTFGLYIDTTEIPAGAIEKQLGPKWTKNGG